MITLDHWITHWASKTHNENRIGDRIGNRNEKRIETYNYIKSVRNGNQEIKRLFLWFLNGVWAYFSRIFLSSS